LNDVNVESAIRFLGLAKQMGVGLDLWRLQNVFWEVVSQQKERVGSADDLLFALADALKFSGRMVDMSCRSSSWDASNNH